MTPCRINNTLKLFNAPLHSKLQPLHIPSINSSCIMTERVAEVFFVWKNSASHGIQTARRWQLPAGGRIQKTEPARSPSPPLPHPRKAHRLHSFWEHRPLRVSACTLRDSLPLPRKTPACQPRSQNETATACIVSPARISKENWQDARQHQPAISGARGL